MTYWIIATGYNCAKYADRCIQSVLNQTNKNWNLFIVDDGSTDGTHRIISKYNSQNVRSYSHVTNVGRCYHFWLILKKMNFIKPDDVIVCLGLDDYLEKDAIDKINFQYENGAWMTYGNWKNQNGQKNKILEYPDNVFKDKSFRKHKWLATATQTFKRFLFDAVVEEDLKHNDKYIDTCTDLALTFPLLEQCPKERIGIIENPIYIYDQSRKDTSTKRLGKAHKTMIREHLKTMPIKPTYV